MPKNVGCSTSVSTAKTMVDGLAYIFGQAVGTSASIAVMWAMAAHAFGWGNSNESSSEATSDMTYMPAGNATSGYVEDSMASAEESARNALLAHQGIVQGVTTVGTGIATYTISNDATNAAVKSIGYWLVNKWSDGPARGQDGHVAEASRLEDAASGSLYAAPPPPPPRNSGAVQQYDEERHLGDDLEGGYGAVDQRRPGMGSSGGWD